MIKTELIIEHEDEYLDVKINSFLRKLGKASPHYELIDIKYAPHNEVSNRSALIIYKV